MPGSITNVQRIKNSYSFKVRFAVQFFNGRPKYTVSNSLNKELNLLPT